MLASFKNLPIARKLTVFCILTSLASLMITMSAIIFYDNKHFEEIIKDELVVLASVISNQSSAAVIFDDQELAKKNLTALAYRKTIVSACIYKVTTEQSNNTRHRLASYPNDNAQCPNHTPKQTSLFNSVDGKFIELVQPITLDSSIIAYLHIKSSTQDLHERRNDYFKVIAAASVAAVTVAFGLASLFAGWTSAPLLSLGKTVRSVTGQDNYSHRAVKYHEDEIGEVVDSFNHMLDIIEREDTKLRDSEEKFRLISASSKVGIFQLDIDGNCVYANDELSVITGLSNEAILKSNWISVVHPDDRPVIKSKWKNMLTHAQSSNINCRLKTPTLKWVNGHVGLLKRNDDQVIGFLGTINDITDVKNAQVQLEQMAFYDTLTGLANRRLFRNRLEHVLNNLNREGNSLGLILIDIDNFKNINDSLGHDAGDSLLKMIAERLQQCVRASDTVARLGGDEFAIILPSINNSLAASHVAQKIINTLKQAITLKETELRVTASAGISIAPEDSSNAETLIKNADMALYRAKDLGRDNYQFFTSEMNTNLLSHLALIKDLREATTNLDFQLVYQPQIDLNNGRLVGFEALIRWQRPQQGLVSPMIFIPAAEETGLIIPIGRWVITAACQQLKNLCDQGVIDNSVVMTVNLSVKQFQDEGLISFIQTALFKFKLKPSQFEVELTETVLMENLDEVLVKLEALKKLGILISIDDFGTGYSSLGYLKRLPVNIVKVDRSFVMDIPQDQDDMKITAAVIAMSHSLGYQVVAEGVETQQQLEFLKQCNCDFGQGYLFSKPLEPDSIKSFRNNFSLSQLRNASNS